jgi:hypothetical protein
MTCEGLPKRKGGRSKSKAVGDIHLSSQAYITCLIDVLSLVILKLILSPAIYLARQNDHKKGV